MKRLVLAAVSAIAGYSQAALAMHINPLQTVRRMLFLDAPIVRVGSSTNQYAGRTVLNSGSTTVTVSTKAISAGDLIQATVQHFTVQDSGVGAGFCVRTISTGNFFTMSWSDGRARGFDATVMWEIRRAA